MLSIILQIFTTLRLRNPDRIKIQTIWHFNDRIQRELRFQIYKIFLLLKYFVFQIFSIVSQNKAYRLPQNQLPNYCKNPFCFHKLFQSDTWKIIKLFIIFWDFRLTLYKKIKWTMLKFMIIFQIESGEILWQRPDRPFFHHNLTQFDYTCKNNHHPSHKSFLFSPKAFSAIHFCVTRECCSSKRWSVWRLSTNCSPTQNHLSPELEKRRKLFRIKLTWI